MNEKYLVNKKEIPLYVSLTNCSLRELIKIKLKGIYESIRKKDRTKNSMEDSGKL